MTSTKKKSRPKSGGLSPAAGVRTGLNVAELKQSFQDNLFCGLGRAPMAATPHDAYVALAMSVRDRVLKQGVRTLEAYEEQDARVVAYLSAEFLPGPHLANNLLNLGILEQTRQAMSELGLNLDELVDAGVLATEIEKRTGKEARACVLGHLQRGGSPTNFDRALCTIFGAEAVELIAAGRSGEMVAYQVSQVAAVKITDAIGRLKTVPPTGSFVRTARALGVCLGD